MSERRVKRNREDWLKVVTDQEESSKPQEEYCRSEGIPRSTFIKWRGLLKHEAPGFVELKPKAEIGGGARLAADSCVFGTSRYAQRVPWTDCSGTQYPNEEALSGDLYVFINRARMNLPRIGGQKS